MPDDPGFDPVFHSEDELDKKFNSPSSGDKPPRKAPSTKKAASTRPNRGGSSSSPSSPSPDDGATPALLKPLSGQNKQIAEGLTGLYTQIGAVLSMADPHCGQAIIENAENCGQSLGRLAEKNPKVRKALLTMIEGSAMGMVLTAHMPLLMALDAHHTKIIPKAMEKARSRNNVNSANQTTAS